MARTLTDTWKEHAFPDEYPAKEQIWAEESQQRREDTRREIYAEHAGLRIRRHTSDRADHRSRAAKDKMLDAMLLAVSSPAYVEAYNNELTFTINGADFEIKQGELFERAKDRAGDLREQIDAAKRRGDSAEEITRLQNNLNDVLFVRDTTDPRRDKITDEDHQAIQDVLQREPVLTRSSAPTGNEAVFRRDSGNEKTQAADMSSSMDQDAVENSVIEGWAQDDSRASFAGTVDESEMNSATAPLSTEFALSIENQTTAIALDENLNKQAEPQRTTGLDL